MSTSTEWFSGSKKGLAGIARRRGVAYILLELVQNAWDSGAQNVSVSFKPVQGRPFVDVQVEDDSPEGFHDLAHAWTLFAESVRKNDPEKRGRFCLGEKLVLSLCETAVIRTTKGTVEFNSDGRHEHARRKAERGTIFLGRVKMSRDDLTEIMLVAKNLIPPANVRTTIYGPDCIEILEPASRKPFREFEMSLPTEIADEEGALKERVRKTKVRVYDKVASETASEACHGQLFEMGIPVCHIDLPWDIEIMQKIPLGMERDNVKRAYRRTVVTHVLNHMADAIGHDEARLSTVTEALAHPDIATDVVAKVLEEQYGAKRAVFDLNDPEANNTLVAEGYKIIHGKSFSKAAWENIRKSNAALPSGQIRPTPKPYSTDPNAPNRKLLAERDWTDGMRTAARYIDVIARKLLGHGVTMTVDQGRMSGCGACYGNNEITFSLPLCGRDFFEPQGNMARFNQLLIHELAHDHESNHLDINYQRECQRLGAELTQLALDEPQIFDTMRGRA